MDQEQEGIVSRFLATRARRPGNIAFIGRSDGQFSGNVKYLFLHFVEHVPQCKSVFVTMNREVYKELHMRGLPTVLFPEMDALEALAAASVVVVDDFQFRENNISFFTVNAKIVQMWHGVGFKKIGFVEIETSLEMTTERRMHLKEMYSDYDAVISTSPFYTEKLFKTSFGAKEIWETGYPRNDVLLRKCTKNELIGCDIHIYAHLHKLGKSFKTCLYAPTFRDDHSDPFAQGVLELARLSEFLEREKIVLFLKLHPLSKQYMTRNLNNIVMLSNNCDIYPLLPLFDCMITDYSSIFMDYLHLLRPVIFFPYDKADYETRLREFQFDYDVMTPGPKCFTQDALLSRLGDCLRGPDTFLPERERLRALAFSHNDALAASRVAEHVLRIAGES